MIKKIFLLSVFLFFSTIDILQGGEIYSAHYRPDSIDYTGAIHIYLKNPTKNPLRIKEIKLDNHSIGPLVNEDIIKNPVEFRKRYIKVINKNVLWYRVWPNPIPAKGISEIIIRLARKPSQLEAQIDIITENQKEIKVNLDYKTPSIFLSYVSFSPDLRVVYLYVKKRDGNFNLSKVSLDGKDVTRISKIFSPEFFHNLSLVKITLNKPLHEGSFHTFKVETKQGANIASMVRTLPPYFWIGTVSGFSKAIGKNFKSHFMNTTIGAGGVSKGSLNTFPELGIKSAGIIIQSVYDYENETKEDVYYANPKALLAIKDYPGFWGHFLRDEPDGTYPWQGSCRDMQRADEFCRRLDSVHPTQIMIDHSGTPKNFYAFGEIADTFVSHAFSINRQNVKKHNLWARESSYPRAFYYICHLRYIHNIATKIKKGEKCANRENARIEVYYALSEGVKGIMYYPLNPYSNIFSVGKKYWDDIGKLNAELEMAAPLLVQGDVLPLAKTDIDTLDVSTILSGDDSIVLIISNNDFISKKDSFSYTPAEKIMIEVDIPPWFKIVDGFSIDSKGIDKIKYEDRGDKISLMLDRVDLTKLIVLTQDKGLCKQLKKMYNEKILPGLELMKHAG